MGNVFGFFSLQDNFSGLDHVVLIMIWGFPEMEVPLLVDDL